MKVWSISFSLHPKWKLELYLGTLINGEISLFLMQEIEKRQVDRYESAKEEAVWVLGRDRKDTCFSLFPPKIEKKIEKSASII